MPDPNVQLITISGVLDLATERQLRSDLSQAAGDRSRELLVDLRGVTFIDSSALALLVHTDQQLRRQNRVMACIIQPGPVERLLETTGLRSKLQLFACPQEATAHVRKAGAPPPG